MVTLSDRVCAGQISHYKWVITIADFSSFCHADYHLILQILEYEVKNWTALICPEFY